MATKNPTKLRERLYNLKDKRDELNNFYAEIDNKDLSPNETFEKRQLTLNKLNAKIRAISEKIFSLEYALRWT